MRAAHLHRLAFAGLAVLAAPVAAHAQAVAAAAPNDLSVTVYRNPNRGAGGFDLNNLGGFALITETRHVTLTPGEHRLRFEGVADGIEPASAIVTGLPSGVIEKNRDAALLSPLALVEKAQEQGGRVQVVRTDPGSGRTVRVEGTIRSGADGGVVFQTPDGIEALRCSGLSETFSFNSATTGLSARPTLSVLTRTDKPIEAEVQLSYLAHGFDWAADYVASMKAGGKLDLGAWVTLANGNGGGFPNARVQIVAGRLNRSTGEIEPIDIGQPILAQCWPQGSTSDSPDAVTIERAYPLGFSPMRYPMAMPAPPPMAAGRAMDKESVAVTGAMIVQQEELGDLKLYRIPDRTTVASRQSKQVRLLDKSAVPILKLYEAELYANSNVQSAPVPILLRTRNDTKSNLGLPLPSGRVSIFETAGSGAAARRLLSGETSLRDIAVDEETELRLNGGADVRVSQTNEQVAVTGAPAVPFVPGIDANGYRLQAITRVELTNARSSPAQVEVRLSLNGGMQLLKADKPVAQKNGRPIFRVTVPANGSLQIRYQTGMR